MPPRGIGESDPGRRAPGCGDGASVRRRTKGTLALGMGFPSSCSGSTHERMIAVIQDLWYKNAVIYCLEVGSYMDANGDGIGDFSGLMRRLDYLHGLGITAVWLMPFQTSPRRDHGYDITDYYAVDPVSAPLATSSSSRMPRSNVACEC